MHPPDPDKTHLGIADATLDLESRRLTRNGVEVALRPKSMDVLVLLAQQPRRLVSKQVILDTVWPRTVVTQDSVTQCIIEVRRALGDTDHTIVRTVPKRGYILNVDVQTQNLATQADATAELAPTTPADTAAKTPARLAFVAGAITLQGTLLLVTRTVSGPSPSSEVAPETSATPRIAVLPLDDVSQDGQFSFLADGIAHEVTHSLAREPALRVIAVTSARALAQSGPDPTHVARKLGVSHVLTGGLNVVDDQVRVTAQLVDASSSQVLWSQAFERTLDDALALNVELASAVADSLRQSQALSGGANTVLAWEPAAYIAFLKGQFFFSRRAEGDVDRARAAFEEATTRDPGKARAWAGLAGALWVQIASDRMPHENGIAEFRHAAERALALDPQLVEAHIRMANYWYANDNWAKAESHLTRATQIDPENILLLTVLAGNAALTGDIRHGLSLQRRAAQLDPLSAVVRENLAYYYFAAGELEQARTEFRELIHLEPNRTPSVSARLAEIAILQGRDDEAVSLLRDGGVEPVSRTNAIVLWHTGQHDAANAVLDQMIDAGDGNVLAMIDIAKVYAHRRDAESAQRWLDASVAEVTLGGTSSMAICYAAYQARHSPLLAAVENESGWRSSVAQLVALRDENMNGPRDGGSEREDSALRTQVRMQ